MKRFLMTLVSVSVALAAGQALALTTDQRVDNFRLLDQNGQSHELYYYDDAKAIVFLVQGNGCPIVRNALPRFKELRDEYAAKGVTFLMINSNLQDNRISVSRESGEFDFTLPVLLDESQIIGEALGLIRTGEVFVLDPRTWTVTYQGAIDDRLTYENQKASASDHYLRDALDDMLASRPVQVASTDALGCLINFPEQRDPSLHAQISYSDTIAPMLIDNCVSCHRPNGIGPWAMTDYSMVRGFSPMIREVVRTRRMPPWHADPAYGHFSNDRSLTPEQTRQLVHWIEAGSPRGDGPDPLVEFEHNWPTWALGEPDLIIDIPGTEVPATGVVEYQYIRVKNPLEEDVWVRASEILPGDRTVLHHVISRFGEVQTEGPRKGRLKRRGGGGLAGYVPGYTVRPLPDGTGTLLPAGATIEFQMHYTTTGKATVDESQIGIYFHDEPPAHRINAMILINGRINIPAHAKAHKEFAEQTLKKDAIIYSLLPHAHFRGKASQFSAVYPDGREEILLSVPDYDFNWQTTYLLEEPIVLPAGTRIVHTTWWDNSAQNPANPDPTRDVTWGQQSWEEMLFGAVSLRYLEEGEEPPRQIASGDD